MFDSFSDPSIWIVTALLIGIIWLQQRASRKDGFNSGVALGVAYGIRQTARILTNGNYVVQSNTGNKIEMTDELIAELATQIMNSMNEQPNKSVTETQ